MKLPVGWIWVTMRLLDTLGSVEFLEVVGDDLEVPPAWKFEAEVEGSKLIASDGERWSKLSTKGQAFAQIHSGAALITMETTATTTASSLARASPPSTPSKSSQFKVYCSGPMSLGHSSKQLKCTFPSLLLWWWWSWNFFWLCVA